MDSASRRYLEGQTTEKGCTFDTIVGELQFKCIVDITKIGPKAFVVKTDTCVYLQHNYSVVCAYNRRNRIPVIDAYYGVHKTATLTKFIKGIGVEYKKSEFGKSIKLGYLNAIGYLPGSNCVDAYKINGERKRYGVC